MSSGRCGSGPRSATDPSPADIGNLLLPVSQIQQAKAQDKASDELEKRSDDLADRQDALADQQKADGEAAGHKADEATQESLDKLSDQRAEAVKARADAAGRPAGDAVEARTCGAVPRERELPVCGQRSGRSPSPAGRPINPAVRRRRASAPGWLAKAPARPGAPKRSPGRPAR